MANATPPTLVAGAARTPLPYGLFSIIDFRPEDSAHWQGGGVTWEFLRAGGPAAIGILGPVTDQGEASTGLPLAFSTIASGTVDGDVDISTQFTVYSSFKQTPVAWTPARAAERVMAELLAHEEGKVESELWTGAAGGSPALSEAPTTVGTFATAALTSALGALEAYIASTYEAVGLIHMSRLYASIMLQRGTLVTKGTRLFTALGTPVVAGTGYPTGTIMSTPAMFGYRSNPFTSSNIPGDLLNQGHNDLYAVAERTYLLGFDPTGVGSATITA
jgi:hypothetical protein